MRAITFCIMSCRAILSDNYILSVYRKETLPVFLYELKIFDELITKRHICGLEKVFINVLPSMTLIS